MGFVKVPIARGIAVERFRMDANVIRGLNGDLALKRIVVGVLTIAITAMKKLGWLSALGQASILARCLIAM